MGIAVPDPKTILCLDIDGTLIDSNEQIHPKDVQALQHFPPEVLLILTTGRPLHSVKLLLQKNGLFTDRKLPMPGVFMNGGAAYFPDEKLCLAHPFIQETSQMLLDLARTFPSTEFVFFTISEAYPVNPTLYGNRILHLHHIHSVGKALIEILEKIIKVMTMDENPETLDRIREKTKGLAAEMTFSLPYIFEFNPPGITKANTLLQLLQQLASGDFPIYAAGDGENDLSLFRLSKRSFAPDTAHPKILNQADQIIPRNQNGLLEPILKQIL